MTMPSIARQLDPRRSLMAATAWLIIALAATFSVAASVWVGGLAREIVLQQHVRRLALETDQIGSDITQAMATRVGALRVAEAMLAGPASHPGGQELRDVFGQLVTAYPALDWLAIAGMDGRIVAARDSTLVGTDARATAWFRAGMAGHWVGSMGSPGDQYRLLDGSAPALGDFATPIRDASGTVAGVIVSRLSWRWSTNHLQRLTEAVGPQGAADVTLLDSGRVVLVGPASWCGKPWPGVPLDADSRSQLAASGSGAPGAPNTPRFEALPNGRTVLVARSPILAPGQPPASTYWVQLSEPNDRVYERADGLARQILWVSVFLGAATALIGAVGASRLTRRLRRLTQSVVAAGKTEGSSIAVPPGHDEVAKLGSAFADLLRDLRQERSELRALSADLEQRVGQRTREVERLAEEARYAALVRERLKIARDLHDTLAHSLMALLSEIRLLRRLQVHDPQSLGAELARAEQVAQDGIAEARNAIKQMRVNTVRDTGLGAALYNAVTAFTNNTGISVDYDSDPVAASVGDERAETVFRMAAEVLRNVERHAGATRVAVTLREAPGGRCELKIQDNGVGFDASASYQDHFGLVGLREQAQLITADLEIDSVADQGTRVTISWSVAPSS